MDTNTVKTDSPQNTSVKTDISQNATETKAPQPTIKDKEPQLITLKTVDWNAARLWQRIQNGGDRMFPE